MVTNLITTVIRLVSGYLEKGKHNVEKSYDANYWAFPNEYETKASIRKPQHKDWEICIYLS